jgi:alcohol dehydrogenase YqhD (iron-dependent ADH family)
VAYAARENVRVGPSGGVLASSSASPIVAYAAHKDGMRVEPVVPLLAVGCAHAVDRGSALSASAQIKGEVQDMLSYASAQL